MMLRALTSFAAVAVLAGCAGSSDSLMDPPPKKAILCPSGIGARDAETPTLTSKTKGAVFIVCGAIDEFRKPAKGVAMTEFDAYALSDSGLPDEVKPVRHLQASAVQSYDIVTNANGSLTFTEIVGGTPVLERVLSCEGKACGASPPKCVFAKDLPRYGKALTSAKPLNGMLETEEGQRQIFFAALSGHIPAAEVLLKPGKAKLDGALAESHDKFRSTYQRCAESR